MYVRESAEFRSGMEWVGAGRSGGARSIGGILLMLLAAWLLVLPGATRAQVLNPSYVSFLPDPPMADQPLSIRIEVTPCAIGYLFDQNVMIELIGNRIELTLDHVLVPVCSPPTFVPYEIVVPLGTYPAGDYEVLVIGRDQLDPQNRLALILATITIIPQNLAVPAPASIPVGSPAALVLLALSLLMLGAWRMRALP